MREKINYKTSKWKVLQQSFVLVCLNIVFDFYVLFNWLDRVNSGDYTHKCVFMTTTNFNFLQYLNGTQLFDPTLNEFRHLV